MTVEDVALFDVKLKIREQVRENWMDHGGDLFRGLANTEPRVLIILDEFAMMLDRMSQSQTGREEARACLRWLRSIRQTYPDRIRFLIGGSIGVSQVLRRLGEPTALNDLKRVVLQPFTVKSADAFLELLAVSQGFDLSPEIRTAMLDTIGTPVPFFLQVFFAEVRTAITLEGEHPTVALIRQLYRERVLGNECKSYFDYFYGRLALYYDAGSYAAAKTILRRLAAAGPAQPSECRHLFETAAGANASDDDYDALMAQLEEDFYIQRESSGGAFAFASKLLRDWWLRYHGLENDGGRV